MTLDVLEIFGESGRGVGEGSLVHAEDHSGLGEPAAHVGECRVEVDPLTGGDHDERLQCRSRHFDLDPLVHWNATVAVVFEWAGSEPPIR